MLRLLALACLSLSLEAQVKINEVLFYLDPNNQDTFRNHQWLELYNPTANPVDLTSWTVSGADGVNGASARPLPAVMLPPGGYLVVHFSSGTNRLDFSDNTGDFYTGDGSPAAPFWSIDADEAALYSSSGIVDFVNWGRLAIAYKPGQAEQDAVAAKMWTAGAILRHDAVGLDRGELVRFVIQGDSIGRDPFSTDTDTPADFNPLGGASSLGPTPNAQNLGVMPTVPASQGPQARPQILKRRDDAPQPAWTVMLFMNGDNNLEPLMIQSLCRVQQAGGSSGNVNFVVMLDLKNIPDATSMQSTTYRGLLPPAASFANCSLQPTVAGLSDIGERDMGDPSELAGFIAWAKQNYPATHYGLVLSSHGDGWKSFGPDETFPQGTRQTVDALYMGELSSALSGQTFDWIAFHACMMAAVEVAHQLKPFANYLLASEEVMSAYEFPYETMTTGLAANPGWGALDSASDMFTNWVASAASNPNGNFSQSYTVSLIDLTQVNNLSINIRAWADLLAPGMSLFQTRDTPDDNVQIVTKNQRNAAQTFKDTNFIDLYDFSNRMLGAGLPPCLTSPIQSILNLISNRVVVKESHGAARPNAHGIHIYFPQRRMTALAVGSDGLLPKDAAGRTAAFYSVSDAANQPYDFPYSRLFDGSSPFAHYGVNQDQLPLKSRDPETGADFDIGAGSSITWPLPQSPGFLFPNDTGWRKVLDRFYHPAADNHILPAKLPDGTVINPTQTGGGACANPMDTITVPVGTAVTFSAKGSSDADADQILENLPIHYFWDADSNNGCLLGAKCVAPFQVPAGADAATATTNMDADRDRAFTNTDQNDFDASILTKTCLIAGQTTITLMPWDDDHLLPFHNTRKDANYVHPQSGFHQAILNCFTPVTFYPTSGTMKLNFTVVSDPFVSDPYVGLGGQTATVKFTTMPKSSTGPVAPQDATSTIALTGDRFAIPNGTGSYDPTNGAWSATITASSTPIAGFYGVQVKWVNMQFTGTGNNTVTGTYQVGTNGQLNGEPQPITYKVTGTVTRN